MCGIVGVVSHKNVVDRLITGLEKLEYRGYDSAGIAVINQDGQIQRVRAVGKLKQLKQKLESIEIFGYIGIGHTRWATHGKPTENNAHPIMTKNIALVHNGIVENYTELKFNLQKDGYVFGSDTDTEVIAQLLQKQIDGNVKPREAFRIMLETIVGSYALATVFNTESDTLFIAKNRSPLIIGIGNDGDIYIGSDVTSVANYCSEAIYMDDGEYAEIKHGDIQLFDQKYNKIEKPRAKISDDMINNGKGMFDHYMMKEIMEQSTAIRNTLLYNNVANNIFDGVSNILILACGSSYHAGLVARYWFEKFLKIPTSVEIASEYRYRSPVILNNTLLIGITQSGETIDTLEAMEYVRRNSNCKVMSISNIKNSAIPRMSDIVLYTEAGVEVGVASTKAFTAQLSLLAKMAFSPNDFICQKLQDVPMICENVFLMSDDIKKIAHNCSQTNGVIFLGRDSLYPIALEGALKVKETSYINAEGFAAGEMKHGPIAMIDDSIPVICLCPHNSVFDKMLSNVQTAYARGKNIIVLTDKTGADFMPSEINKIIMPDVTEECAPIIYTIPLQLFAYYLAVEKGTDVDKPRNLAKSVTVE